MFVLNVAAVILDDSIKPMIYSKLDSE